MIQKAINQGGYLSKNQTLKLRRRQILNPLSRFSIHFQAEHTLAAVRPEHQAFYKRTFKYRSLSGPRPYPLLSKPITLMTSDYREVSDYVYRRYPFFHSSHFERRMLFERTAPLPAAIPLSPAAVEQLPLFAQAR